MQFSEQWLRHYVHTAFTSEELSHALTMSGLEVEAREPVAAQFNQVVIAEIISTEKHPDADRLQICRVNVGTDQPLQIVCGASNARPGLKAPCALVGAELPGFNIKQAKVRNVESFGMMCSAKELGLAEESSGLLELPGNAQVGQDIREYLELNDHVFTLKLTPNRSDCLSIAGVAREVAALTGAALSLSVIKPVSPGIALQKNIRISAAASCPRYAGRIIQAVNAANKTPDWMVRRLERSGIRSISAIVDVTNYVLMEMGQPLHAFDASKLNGDINVRMANAGESIELLNQQAVKLEADMLVIADDSGAIALAGIMGGSSTSVSEATTDIFLESAFFTPDAIAGKARRFGINTDSSYRFERGVDYGNTLQALERATTLIMEICGGNAGPITEVAAELPMRLPVTLRMSRLVSVLGIDLPQADVAKLFDQLGFTYSYSADKFEVTPPSYRFDIDIEEDLIEEIARLHGYDNIPALPPHASLQMLPSHESRLNRNFLRDVLVANAYQEVVSYSFVDEKWEHDLLANADPVKLKNPIASNMSVMRSGLWGGLIDTLIYNLNRKQERVRLFEIGAVYTKKEGGYRETMRISGLAYGDAVPEQWGAESRSVDFFDVKDDVDALSGGLAQYVSAQHPALHPGQCAQVMMQGVTIGWLGKLHPKWQQHYQLPRDTILFELNLDPILQRKLPRYDEVSKFPLVRRDLAIVVDEEIAVESILKSMRDAEIDYKSHVELFDVYRGKGIPENKKSLAFLVLMQDTQKTLTDIEADTVMEKLLNLVVSQHDAVLR